VTYNMAATVDARCNGKKGRGCVVEGGEEAAAIEEAVAGDTVVIISDNLARAVDASCMVEDAQGIVDGGVDARAVEKTVLPSPAVVIISNDLPPTLNSRSNDASPTL